MENPVTSTAVSGEERRLIAALRAGDEATFVGVVDAYGASMLRVARLYVHSQSVAEEVVQETWLRVLGSIGAFEGRSSFRTWIFVILGNCARRRAEGEGRFVSFTESEPTVDPERFFPADHPRWGGMWSTLVDGWNELPEEVLASREAREKITEAVRALPPNYATVFTLRDIEGWEASEVCALLGISSENQRVLLHRARGRIRAALEEYVGQDRR